MGVPGPLLPSRVACLAFLLVLSGCTTPDKVALEEYAPQSPEADIEAVSLSASEDDTFDPERVGTEFPDTTEQVAVWYRWDNADSGKKVGIRWSKDGQVVLEQGDTLAKISGASAYVLKMAAGSKLPIGNYQVELLEDGVAVTKIPFTVGGGEGEQLAAGPAGSDEALEQDASAVTSEEPEGELPPEAAEGSAESSMGAAEPPTEASAEEAQPEEPVAAAPSGTGLAGMSPMQTKWPGVTAQLTEFGRKGKILVAKVRFTNTGNERVRPEFYYYGTYLLDADNKKYEVLKDEKGTYLGSLTGSYHNWWGEYLDPGASQTVWMRFPAPAPSVKVLTLQVNGMDPFEDVRVQN